MWTNGLIALTSSLTLGVAAPAVPPHERPTLDSVEFVDMPATFVDMATWAVDLFDEADLELPPIRYEYHGDDTASCADLLGVHRVADDRSVIHLCRADPGTVTADLILHETAHAWAAWSLGENRRAEFQSLRGWTHWRNHAELRWHENGTEQAAEIIRWGLSDRPVRIVRLNDNGCDALDAGFRVLTGQLPLHGHRDHC